MSPNGINYSDSRGWNGGKYSGPCLRYFYHLKKFHDAPVTKFVFNAASYIVFLLFFSYYLLFAFQPPTDQIPSINWTEILVIIIVSTMLMEDFRTVC